MSHRKPISKSMTPGNPSWRRVTALEETTREHRGQLDEHEVRLTTVERELRGIDHDIATLANVAYRSATRRRRLLAMRLRRSQSSRR